MRIPSLRCVSLETVVLSADPQSLSSYCSAQPPLGMPLVTMRLKTGDLYEGELSDGRRNGWGRFQWLRGDKYIGEWCRGRMEGHGSFQWSNGAVYIGLWRDGRMDGNGEKVLPNGDQYSGDWKDGSLVSGSLVTHTGNHYIGSFEDTEFHGFGRMHYFDGSEFSGNWCRGAYDGFGRFHASDGIVSRGEWRLGRLNGLASQKDESRGLSFVGRFLRGVREGEGTLVWTSSGSECWGEWQGNRLQGPGRIRCVGEVTKSFAGMLLGGQANGVGRCEYGNGDLYEGCFRRNRRSGRGVYVWSNGWTYAGPFREGVPEGSGRFYHGVEEWRGRLRCGHREGHGFYGLRIGDGARVWWRMQEWRSNELVRSSEECCDLEWESEASLLTDIEREEEPFLDCEEKTIAATQEDWEDSLPVMQLVGDSPLPFQYTVSWE